eukprot:1505640-Rhodomonas_salina.1
MMIVSQPLSDDTQLPTLKLQAVLVRELRADRGNTTGYGSSRQRQHDRIWIVDTTLKMDVTVGEYASNCNCKRNVAAEVVCCRNARAL